MDMDMSGTTGTAKQCVSTSEVSGGDNIDDVLECCANCRRRFTNEAYKISVIRGKTPATHSNEHVKFTERLDEIGNKQKVPEATYYEAQKGGGFQCKEKEFLQGSPYDDNYVPISNAMSSIYGFSLDQILNQDVIIWRKEDQPCLCNDCAKVVTTFYQSFQELLKLAHEASYISKGLRQLHQCIQNALSKEVTRIEKHDKNHDKLNKNPISSTYRNNSRRGIPVSTSYLDSSTVANPKGDNFEAGTLLPLSGNDATKRTQSVEEYDSSFDLELVKVETSESEQFQSTTKTQPRVNSKRKKKVAEVQCALEDLVTGSTHILSENGRIIRTSTRTRKIRIPVDFGDNSVTPQTSTKDKTQQCKTGSGKKIENKNALINQQPITQDSQNSLTTPTKEDIPNESDITALINSNRQDKMKTLKSTQIRKKYNKMSSNLQKKENQYKCPHCDKQFLLKSTYEKHLTFHDNQIALCRCTVCDQTFPTVLSLTRHITSAHDKNTEKPGIRLYPCPKCPESEPSHASYDDLKLHFEKIHKCLLHLCMKCGKNFNSLYSLQRHFKSVHKTEPTVVGGEENAKIVNTSMKKGDIASSINVVEGCDDTFEGGADLGAGESQQNGLKPHLQSTGIFKCHICNKEFKKKFLLTRHLLFHNETEPGFGCSQCPKRFFKSSSLQRHIIVHKLKNPFVCQECDKVFVRRDHLKRHMDSTHNKNRKKNKPIGADGNEKSDPALTCTECQKTFSRVEYLRLHMRIHTGEKPYVCEGCGKQFRDPRNLAQHLVTHKNERPFCCSVCGLTFKRAHHLNDHEGTHREDVARPFVCTVPHCGKAFKLRKHLASHEVVHTRAKDHTCHVCGRAFSRKDNVLQHIKKIHGKEFADELLKTLEKQRERHREANSNAEECMKDTERVAEETITIKDGVPSIPPGNNASFVKGDRGGDVNLLSESNQIQEGFQITPVEVTTHAVS